MQNLLGNPGSEGRPVQVSVRLHTPHVKLQDLHQHTHTVTRHHVKLQDLHQHTHSHTPLHSCVKMQNLHQHSHTPSHVKLQDLCQHTPSHVKLQDLLTHTPSHVKLQDLRQQTHTPPVSHSTAAVAALNNTQPVICVRKDVLEDL